MLGAVIHDLVVWGKQRRRRRRRRRRKCKTSKGELISIDKDKDNKNQMNGEETICNNKDILTGSICSQLDKLARIPPPPATSTEPLDSATAQ